MVFQKFAAAFDEYKRSIGWNYSFEDARMFGLRMSKKVREEFSQTLEKEWPEAPQSSIENFKSMFKDEGTVMGIQMLPPCQEDTIYLLKVTEKTKNITISNVSGFQEASVYTPQQLLCPVLKKNFYWPQTIKAKSCKFKDSKKSYFDSKESNEWGLITTFDKSQIREVDLNGKINYKKGNVILERFSKKNEQQYDKLIAASGTMVADPTIKDFDSISMEFIVYEGPVKIAWSYSGESDAST